MSVFLRHYNLKAPNEVALFRVPARGIRRWNDEALVYDVRVREDAGLRHYAFFRRWFHINCSLDPAGNLVTETEPGPFPWCFNCDVATPVFTLNGCAYSMDLELDVFAAPDGRRHFVRDEEAFAHSTAHGWITPAEAVGARRGLEELLAHLHAGTFLAFLDAVCPFRPIADLPLQPPILLHRLREIPPLHAEARSRYYYRGDESRDQTSSLRPGSIDLRARGIGEAQAAELRGRLQTFTEEWNRPDMSAYDDL